MTSILYFLAILFSFVTAENDGRIVGGENVFIKDYPYHAVTYLNTRSYQGLWCGAIIISPKYLLTAAHCARSRKEAYSVVIGVDFVPRYYDEEWLQSRAYKVEKKIVHPGYDSSDIDLIEDFANDIAILAVEGELKLDGNTSRAIDLATQPTVPGTLAAVSGFGSTEREMEPKPNYKRYQPPKEFVYLKAAPIPVVDHDICVKYYSQYPFYTYVKESMICAGAPLDNSACHGDSGGPLVANNKLIGIVSYGAGCGGHIPGVYTDVSKYLDFIRESTNGAVGQSGACFIENRDLISLFSSVFDCISKIGDL